MSANYIVYFPVTQIVISRLQGTLKPHARRLLFQ